MSPKEAALRIVLTAGIIGGAVGIESKVLADNPSNPPSIVHHTPFGDWTEYLPPTLTPEAPKITLPPQEISRGPHLERREIAMTFDCGASAEPLPTILKVLKDQGVKVTFFETGEFAENNPELTRQIVEDGHEIGNHTYSHTSFFKLSSDQIGEELEHTERIIKAITGKSTKPFVRPPYGDTNKTTVNATQNTGWDYSIMWTTVYVEGRGWITGDSGDWLPHTTAGRVYERIMTVIELGNAIISVNHCGSPETAEALPYILQSLKERGYDIVTVSRLLQD